MGVTAVRMPQIGNVRRVSTATDLKEGIRTGYAPPRIPDRHIAVVEDNPELAALLAEDLRELARRVSVCEDGPSALALVAGEPVDLVVLDLCLPGMDGLEVCRAMRAADIATPVLMLTARGNPLDRIVGLEFGADDYMVKPFSMLELLARARAIFRRTESRHDVSPASSGRITVGELVVDSAARRAFRGEQPLSLTEKEFDLFHLFVSNPGRVYTRSQLLDLVWGRGSAIYEYTVTSHINRLRAKIEPDPSNPTLIQTVWGVGYRLQVETS